MLTFLLLGDSALLFPVKDYTVKGNVLTVRGKLEAKRLPAFIDSAKVRGTRTLLFLGKTFAHSEPRGDTLVLYSKGVFAVVVDPGHGGTDFGAFGVSGVR